MAKPAIIGHRGAAGLELENTLPAFKKAADLGVPGIELDVHVTKDGQFVVCHDESLLRLANTPRRVKDLTYDELRAIPLRNGTSVPRLQDVLQLASAHQQAVIVEVKIRHHLEELCLLLDTFTGLDITIASFKHDTLAVIRKLRPQYRLFLAERHHPIEALQKARALKAQGIDLNYRLLNPLAYWLAKRWGLTIMVYTVNNPLVGRVIAFLYPEVLVCTDHPERFMPKRPSKRAKNQSV